MIVKLEDSLKVMSVTVTRGCTVQMFRVQIQKVRLLSPDCHVVTQSSIVYGLIRDMSELLLNLRPRLAKCFVHGTLNHN